nr:hypothetical protein [Escherichia coli]
MLSLRKRWRVKTGARGLRSIVEAALLDTMYESAVHGRRRKSGYRRVGN